MRKPGLLWAFFLDAVLALLPVLPIPRLHGTVSTFIGYWLVLAILRKLDAFAVGKGWGWLTRAGLKIVVIILTGALVLVSAMERCDRDGTNCSRVFF